jgi:hypothetical protein
MKEAPGSSETSVLTRATRRNNPEDTIQHLQAVMLYVSLLPIMSKLFEKLILKRLKSIIAEKHLVPTHQFGFQFHRITDIIEKSLETMACALLSFLTLHKLPTEYGIEA